MFGAFAPDMPSPVYSVWYPVYSDFAFVLQFEMLVFLVCSISCSLTLLIFSHQFSPIFVECCIPAYCLIKAYLRSYIQFCRMPIIHCFITLIQQEHSWSLILMPLSNQLKITQKVQWKCVKFVLEVLDVKSIFISGLQR